MSGFFSLLEARVRFCGSALCVGLDPAPGDLPEPTAGAALSFCLDLISATAEVAAAFKPNAAFFEALGPDGWRALQQVIAAVPEGIPVILDVKRGDIASTAEAYARSAFDELGAGAVTLNPYLGRDSLEPFLARPGKGVFLLCKTSNPGSGDLQDLLVFGSPAQFAGEPTEGARAPAPFARQPATEPGAPAPSAWQPVMGPGAPALSAGEPAEGALSLYERVAGLAARWNTQDNLGLVVGATYPKALARVRRAAPDLWILAPGVGAQGGDLEAALRAGLRPDGLGLLVPSSRAVARARDPRRAAQELADRIAAGARAATDRTARRAAEAPAEGPRSGGDSFPVRLAVLADRLHDAGCVKFGQFTLKSGLQSPIYLDLRQLISDPALLAQVAAAYVDLLSGLAFDRLAALPYAALPIGAAVSLHGSWPMIYPRREAKSYGTGAEIEGVFVPGETAVVVDDLATTGGSKFEAIEKLSAAGLRVRDVVVLIDRGSGAREALQAAGYRLHAVMTLAQMLDHWERTGRVSPEQIAATRAFLAASR
jgi:uridine monophosphate synthetase